MGTTGIGNGPDDQDDGATQADAYAATANPASGDWALLAQFPNAATPAKTVNLSRISVTDAVGFDGTYQVLAVDADTITLATPDQVNANWDQIGPAGTATAYASPTLSTQGEAWVGPFVVDMTDCTRVVANFVAEQGMYRVQGKTGKKLAQFVDVLLEMTPCDLLGNPTGAAVTEQARVYGDGTDTTQKAMTLDATTGWTGRVSVRARRLTDHDLGSNNDTVADEVKWRDCYGVTPVTQAHFGDVTIVVSTTYATAGATSVKERKLNCVATRRVLVRNADGSFGPDLAPSLSAADIICHMLQDPRIGGRPSSELDTDQIHDAVAQVAAYFGIPDAAQFSYTFDQTSVSAEEMVQAVAQAVHCTAYRQGSSLRLFFERATTDSVLLFNHRNKSPGSETRTITFGRYNDFDGVEVDYVLGTDGTTLTYHVPTDQSAMKPNKLQVTGLVDRRGDGAVAALIANRAFNKIVYQTTTTQFDGLAEASQLVVGQRVEVTDNTRPDVFDGEVRGQDGLVLTLSQPFTPVPGVEYTIFLQLPSGGLQTMDCTGGADPMHCVLAAPPAEPLMLDPDAVLTTYQITGSTDARPTAFLVSDRGPFDRETAQVTATNYDARYYANDHDYGGAD